MSENIKNGLFKTFEDKLSDSSTNINEVLLAFENAVLECSEPFRKTRIIKGTRNQRDWFDRECRQYKARAKCNLREFRTTRSVDSLNKYLQSKTEFKNACEVGYTKRSIISIT